MKKVIVATFVAASLFGSAKAVEPKKNEWKGNSSYMCKASADKESAEFDIHLVGYDNLLVGKVVMTRANEEYDVFHGKTVDGDDAYIALNRDGNAYLYLGEGKLLLTCSKK